MKVKEYKGTRDDDLYPVYYIHVNLDYDITGLNDENGRPYKFVGNVVYKGEIKSWKPFRAEYEKRVFVFKCPICGSKNCERPNQLKLADPYFFQGNYICSNCGTDGFNYYSKCFTDIKMQPKQLSLF